MEKDIIDKYVEYEISREKFTDAIVNSSANKKIILAGPGTGKSFLFQKICKKNIEQGKDKNLTLSFINTLVDDLAKDLHKLSEVKTLHSFALNNIHRDTKMFFSLGDIIEDDYEIIMGKEIDFNYIFCNLIEDPNSLDFYSKRRKYYNFFSPNCSIFCLLQIFMQSEDKIPEYSQILIDEFQDFNKLESKLLDFLSSKNPILIVGDDDQSLYNFKHANPNDLRFKHQSEDYTSFPLPYCSRCTKVIIDAFDSVLNKAQSKDFLKDRTPKAYKYFPTIEKDRKSSKNQKIIVKKNVYQSKVAYHIDQEIKNNFDPRSEQLPSVLIICPLNKQIVSLEKALRKKGFRNIDISQKKEDNKLLEGFKLLLDDSKCNLGWRIVSQIIYANKQKEDVFRASNKMNLTGSNI